MGVDVVTSITIRRPRTEVARYAANPDNAPKWYVNIKSVEWRTEPEVRVGSKVAFVVKFLGRTIAYTYEIIVYTPGERLVMQTSEGPFPMETSYEWRDGSDGGTVMTLRNRGEPVGFFRFVAPFMAIAMRSANRKDLARLRQILETDQAAGI